MSRKSRLSIPRSLMAWLSGLMESRGISQVSAMMLAMVSNVEDIGNSLVIWDGKRTANAPKPRAIAPHPHVQGRQSAARIAKHRGKFNGGGPLATLAAWREFALLDGLGRTHICAQRVSPAFFGHLDRRAPAPSGQDAVLVLAHRRHCVSQPDSSADQRGDNKERRDVHDHPVAVVVGAFAAFIPGEVLDRIGRRPWDRASAREFDDARLTLDRKS